MWKQELHVAQGDQKPRQEYSATVKMDLDCNTLNNPFGWESKTHCTFCKTHSPASISSKNLVKELLLIYLLGGRCILLTTIYVPKK